MLLLNILWNKIHYIYFNKLKVYNQVFVILEHNLTVNRVIYRAWKRLWVKCAFKFFYWGNIHIILTILKWTPKWHLVYSHCCATTILSSSVIDWIVPPNSYVGAINLNVTVFGDRAFKEATEVKWGHMGGP